MPSEFLDEAYAAIARGIGLLYTVSKKTGPLGYSQIFLPDLDQYQYFFGTENRQ